MSTLALMAGCGPAGRDGADAGSVTTSILSAPPDEELLPALSEQLAAKDLTGVAETMQALRGRTPSQASYNAIIFTRERLLSQSAPLRPGYLFALTASATTLAHFRVNGFSMSADYSKAIGESFVETLKENDARAREEAIEGLGFLANAGSSRIIAEHARRHDDSPDFAVALAALETTCDPDADRELAALASWADDGSLKREIENVRQGRLRLSKTMQRLCEQQPSQAEPPSSDNG